MIIWVQFNFLQNVTTKLFIIAKYSNLYVIDYHVCLSNYIRIDIDKL